MKYLKQKQIADKLNVSESRLSRLVSGDRGKEPHIEKQLSILTSSNLETWLFCTEKNIALRKKLIKKITDKKFIKVSHALNNTNPKTKKRGQNA